MTETTENKVLDAAEHLFAERGFTATTTRALAERAGVNEVTVFRLFGNKIGVLLGVFRRAGIDRTRREAEAGQLRGGPREVLTELATREVSTSAEHGPLAIRIAFEASSVPELAELVGEGPAENLKALSGLFAGWQAEGLVRRDIDPRAMAEAFSSLTSSVVMYRHVMGLKPQGEMGLEDTARQLTEVFLGGVLEKKETRK